MIHHWPLELYHATSMSLGVVIILTITCLRNFRTAQANSKSQHIYQDEDGIAPNDSDLAAGASPGVAISLVNFATAIGFLTSILDTTSNSSVSSQCMNLNADWSVMLWMLLAIQVGAISNTAAFKVSATALVIVFIFFSFPKRPVVVFKGQEVFNEKGASVLDWLSFSWGFLHQDAAAVPAKLTLQDIPVPGYHQRVQVIRKQFTQNGQSLWIALVRTVLKYFALQWIFVFLKALSEFGSRFALHKLLQRLERDSAHDEDAWVWVGLIALGLLGETISGNWLTWITHSKMLVPLIALLQSLIFEKTMHKQHFHNSAEQEVNNAKRDDVSIGDMISNDSSTIAQASVDSYHFPMAALKLLFDVVYLTRLLGIKSVFIGSILPTIAIPVTKILSKKHQTLQAERSKAHSILSNLISEALQGLHNSRLSSMERVWEQRLLESRMHEQAHVWAAGVHLEILNLVANLGPLLLGSVSISIHAYDTGYLSPSVAFASLSLFGNLHAAFRQLPHMAASVHKSWISCQKVDQYLQQPNQISSSRESSCICLKDVCIKWPTKEEDASFTLRNVTLSFPRYKLSVVVGKVGSGKSLLLAALLDEAVIQSGSFGKPLIAPKSENHTTISGSTAFVSQPPWIDDRTIKENIVFGYDFNEARYKRVLTACALNRDLDDLSDGDLTKAGAGGAALSGGQRWRIALARALYSPTEILILEDILGALDAPIARWICDNALKGEMAGDRTIILATHHPRLCLHSANYLVTVKDGTAWGNLNVRKERKLDLVEENAKQDLLSDEKNESPMPKDEEDATNHASKPSNLAPAKAKLEQSRARSHWQILLAYLHATGSLKKYIFGALITICHRFFSAGHSWWLTKWTIAKEHGQNDSMIYNVGVYHILSAGSAVALASQSLLFTSIGLAASKSLFERMVQSILTAKLHWIDTTPFGKLVQSLDHDMYMIDGRIAPQLNGILSTIIHLIFITIASSLSTPYTIVSSVILLAFYLYFASRVFTISGKLRPLMGPSLFPISGHINSATLGLTTIRAFNKTQFYINGMQDLIDISTKVYLHIAVGMRWSNVRQGLLGTVFVTVTAAAMVYNHIDAATAGFTITLALELRAVLSTLINQVGAVRHGFNAIDRVLDLADIPTETKEGEVAAQSWPSGGGIEVQNLTVRYDQTLPAILKNVSFALKPGQRLGIVGRTGAGKTSLTNALLRFIASTAVEGKIYIDGVDISTIQLHRLRSVITILPQDPFLFSGTLRSNLDLYGDFSDEELLSILHRVRLLPTGGKTGANFADMSMAIHSSGTNLSHGQRQLLCLARAMLAKCRILILDEATSGVDASTDIVIQQTIRDEFPGVTVLVVAHKLVTVADLDSILVLDNGEVVEFGAPKQLLGEKGVFWDMVNDSGEREKIMAVVESSRC